MTNEQLSKQLIELTQRTDVPTDVRMEILFIADELSDYPILRGGDKE